MASHSTRSHFHARESFGEASLGSREAYPKHKSSWYRVVKYKHCLLQNDHNASLRHAWCKLFFTFYAPRKADIFITGCHSCKLDVIATTQEMVKVIAIATGRESPMFRKSVSQTNSGCHLHLREWCFGLSGWVQYYTHKMRKAQPWIGRPPSKGTHDHGELPQSATGVNHTRA